MRTGFFVPKASCMRFLKTDSRGNSRPRSIMRRSRSGCFISSITSLFGMCWFHPESGFRSIIQALEYPWWTEQLWRTRNPVICPPGYPVTEEVRRVKCAHCRPRRRESGNSIAGTTSSRSRPQGCNGHDPPFRPSLDESVIQSVVQTLRSGWISEGQQVKAFENMFSRTFSLPHALALHSGTAALHLAVIGAGVTEGDEVITTTQTFVATALSILYAGARPSLPIFSRAAPISTPTTLHTE